MNNDQQPDRKSAASQNVPSDFEEKTRRAAPQLSGAFERAHDNNPQPKQEMDLTDSGSQQVRETASAPRPVPPSALNHAGARQAHNDALYRDRQTAKARNERGKEEQRTASKEAFLKAAAEKKKNLEPNQGMERQ